MMVIFVGCFFFFWGGGVFLVMRNFESVVQEKRQMIKNVWKPLILLIVSLRMLPKDAIKQDEI